MNTTSSESVTDRIARLKLEDIGPTRLTLLTEAHPFVDDATFVRISDAMRVSKGATVVLPAHKYEGLSRGKGWARRMGCRACDRRLRDVDGSVVSAPKDLVVFERMPDCHRSSHRAARNWGVYPANGAERVLMLREDAEAAAADDADEYDHIVRDAVDGDEDEYEVSS